MGLFIGALVADPSIIVITFTVTDDTIVVGMRAINPITSVRSLAARAPTPARILSRCTMSAFTQNLDWHSIFPIHELNMRPFDLNCCYKKLINGI